MNDTTRLVPAHLSCLADADNISNEKLDGHQTPEE